MRRKRIGARRLHLAVLAVALVTLFPAATLACPICFQIDDTNTVAGVRAGVVVLMSVTVVVLGAVAAFAIRLWRNEQAGGSDE